MTLILVATQSGFRTFGPAGEGKPELAGRRVDAVTPEGGGACVAVVDGQELWRRGDAGAWTQIAKAGIDLQSLASSGGTLWGGGANEAALVCFPSSGQEERRLTLDAVAGRATWFANGPPLGVRALTATADGAALLVAVHVGGIVRSSDQGETWTPTIPIAYDVHEVRAHASAAHVAAAATAVGLCVSQDGGRHWRVFSEGIGITNALAVAVLSDEVLFSIQDGPFARRSQIWRWRIGGGALEQVRGGLPEWLDGKVDTGWLTAGGGRAALVDGGGSLWFSSAGSTGWTPAARELTGVSGLVIL